MRTILNPTGLALASLAIGFDAEAPGSGGEAPAVDPNVFTFPVAGAKDPDGKDILMSVNLTEIPPEVRLELLKAQVRGYVTNSVNQEAQRAKKANEPFDAYDAASAADPLQTAVAKPEGERKTADLIGTAQAARTRLYEGKMRKQGEAKPKVAKDPLNAMVTSAVVREVFEKNSAATPGYKWTDAVKEVGGDGKAYLEKRITKLVAAGGDEAALRKTLDERFIKPAQLMLGQRSTKATEAQLL